eukprot:756845-Hanusia_phi.AAC.3
MAAASLRARLMLRSGWWRGGGGGGGAAAAAAGSRWLSESTSLSSQPTSTILFWHGPAFSCMGIRQNTPFVIASKRAASVWLGGRWRLLHVLCSKSFHMTCKRETELVGISRRYLTTARKGDRDNKVVDYHTRPRAEKLLNSRYLLEPTEFEMPHAYIPSDKLIFAEQFNRYMPASNSLAENEMQTGVWRWTRRVFSVRFLVFAYAARSLYFQDCLTGEYEEDCCCLKLTYSKVTIYTPFFLTERKIETETSSIRPALMKRVFGRKDASPLDVGTTRFISRLSLGVQLQNIRTFLIEVDRITAR